MMRAAARRMLAGLFAVSPTVPQPIYRACIRQASSNRGLRKPAPFPYNILKETRAQLPHRGTGLHVTDYFPFSVIKRPSFQHARRPFWLKPLFFIPMGSLLALFVSRLDRVEMTGRVRLLPIPLDLYDKYMAPYLDEVFFAEIQQTKAFYPHTSREHQLVQKVIAQLVRANNLDQKLIEQTFVMQDEEPNAFCTGNGTIVVHSALIHLFEGDQDMLAMVLAHEISHYLCRHTAEQSGFQLLAVLAAKLFGIKSELATQFYHLFFQLPRSRLCELEADQLGLKLNATACFDIDKAQSVWMRIMAFEMAIRKAQDLGISQIDITTSELEAYADETAALNILSDHPSWRERMHNFEPASPWMKDAKSIQQESCRVCASDTAPSLRIRLFDQLGL
eukprot:TRINITY_DN12489_c3_g1_i1.p2 TRINITY_DN12489_c3_g1~~TRINITY_DN12489_c3_g1_i1.p2  ORF type:complete len:391 (+),score=47.14 TRINITY_DN12489_c3_g1_i1:2255-3427(+)